MEHQKSVILLKTMLLLVVIQRHKIVFFNKIQPVSLDVNKPWSVTCPSTVESLQKMEFKGNNDIN